MTTSDFMQKHGTRAFVLPPSAIVRTAENDLKVRTRKEKFECKPGVHYAFAGYHVRNAKDTADLLKRALSDRERGLKSGKLNTRLIYGDDELLRLALALVADPVAA